MKITLSAVAIAAVLGLGGVAVSAGTASARVVCNADGDCWHTDSRATYGRHVVVQSHPDDWYFHQKWDQSNQRHWRDTHEGRGYYAHGVWVPR